MARRQLPTIAPLSVERRRCRLNRVTAPASTLSVPANATANAPAFAAIDFGTSNSAIALPQGPRGVQLVALEGGRATMPTAVFYRADGPAHAGTGHDPLIEAQLSAERFRELGLKEGDTVLLSARKARVFLQPETV